MKICTCGKSSRNTIFIGAICESCMVDRITNKVLNSLHEFVLISKKDKNLGHYRIEQVITAVCEFYCVSEAQLCRLVGRTPRAVIKARHVVMGIMENHFPNLLSHAQIGKRLGSTGDYHGIVTYGLSRFKSLMKNPDFQKEYETLVEKLSIIVHGRRESTSELSL